MSPPRMLSTAEAARLLGVAVSSISKWVDEGRLVAGRTPGGHRRIEKRSLVRFLEQQGLPVPQELLGGHPRILIIDDDVPFTKWLSEEFGEHLPRAEVMLAFDGYQAGEIMGLSKPEIVILDLHMPGINGLEVCRRIKANPLLQQCSIIVVTGDDSTEVQSQALSLGAVACLVKPFQMEDLLALIVEGS